MGFRRVRPASGLFVGGAVEPPGRLPSRPHDLSQKWKGKRDFEDWIDLVFSVVHILKSGQEQGMGREEVWEGCG